MDNTEKKIARDLKEVHESVDQDPTKKYDPDELKPIIDDLEGQVKGSDADSDQSLGKDSDETKKQEQNKGSDAEKA